MIDITFLNDIGKFEDRKNLDCKQFAKEFAELAKQEFRQYAVTFSMEITRYAGNYTNILNAVKSKFRGKKIYLSNDDNGKIWINVTK